MNIGIIAATIPTLRPLFDKAIRVGRKSSRRSNRYLWRSSNDRYIRKSSGDSISRQLDDKVELNSLASPFDTTQNKFGTAAATAFPSDETSFGSAAKDTETTRVQSGPSATRPANGAFYEHEEEVFDRV